MVTTPPIEIQCSRHFLAWLHEAKISLAFTTYQTNRLFLIGVKEDGSLSTFERHFERPMGLHATADRLCMTTLWQIWELADSLPAGESYRGYDRLYVPRRAHTTGHVDAHDVVVDADGRIVFVNTLYSCLATVTDRYSFTPLWKPPFVSKLVPEDRCHLNGLAMADGKPAYATTVSRSDVVTGWRDRRHAGGTVIDVEDDEIVLDTLSMPHSPRVHGGRLWLLNSGTGELGYVDRAAGRFEPLAFCPGYLRGLAFHGDMALVGLSKQRQERTFSGLALDDRLREKDADARCGLWVIDLKTGNVAHWLKLEGVVIELYDVAVIPDTRRPMALGFKNDEIQRLVTIDMAAGPIFEPLPAPDPASRVAEAAASTPPGTAGVGDVKSSPTPATGDVKPSPVPAAGGRAVAEEATEAARAAYGRGNQLAKATRFVEAIAAYEEALRLDPGHVKARLNLGTARHRLGDKEGALRCWRETLVLDPASPHLLANVAMVLREQGDIEGAIREYERARRLAPASAPILTALGSLLGEAGRPRQARECLEQVVRSQPQSARAHNDLGALLLNEQKGALALPHFEEAARLDPSLFEAELNRGTIFAGLGAIEEARAAFARALTIRDSAPLTLHRELLCPPVWMSSRELDAYRDRAERVIDTFSGRNLGLELSEVHASRAEVPATWIYHGRDNLPLARKHARLFEGVFPNAPLDRRPAAKGPWKVGFVVTPSHEGVFLRCIAGIIDRLDRRRFRVVVACPRGAFDQMRGTFRNPKLELVALPMAFDRAVSQLRDAELDLIYYWEVGSDAINYFLPFCRLAPVQCTGWGWPETTGAPELDVHLSSEALAPAGAERFFSERLVRLPHLPAFALRPPNDPSLAPPEHFGLPAGSRVYFCAQNLRKAHPDFDPMLGAILRADPRGVAVFAGDNSPVLGETLAKRWRESLTDVADRLVVLPRLSPDDYIRLVASADVSLDTPYFGGSNTAYDAVAMGAPVVTLPGQMPRSRYTAALYESMGITDCIAASPDEYADIAVRLATDRTARDELRERILTAAPTVFEKQAAVTELEEFFAAELCATGT